MKEMTEKDHIFFVYHRLVLFSCLLYDLEAFLLLIGFSPLVEWVSYEELCRVTWTLDLERA